MKATIRLTLLASTLAAGMNTGSANAQDMTKLTVVLGYIPNVESFGPVYAKAKGLFEKEGLDVTLVPAGVGVDGVQMVSAGTAQIGISNPELILAGQDKGEKFKVIAGEFQRTPLAMTCRKDSGVTKPADLPGHTLGVKQNAQAFADLFLSKNGIKKSDLKTTAIGPNDVSQIIAGRVDCMITTFAFNEPRQIEDAGVPVNVISLGDWGMNGQSDSYFVKASYLADPKNKEILKKYLKAELEAWKVFFKDPTAAAQFIVNGGFYDGLDMDQQIYQAKAMVGYMTSPLTKQDGFMSLNLATWKETAENDKLAGLTDKVVDPTPMLTDEILKAVGTFKQ
ncbi:ABC transporter substrate-binding protein [Jiella sp. MQZ9-1]|uniref:Thiamine pyrimidine synthase n=1 Tax=Jiella flava TaxID=2816857 RepID=A0A939FZD0_9HYPH|nr:ABC transporter substrate-binding protein [Jiella flava]MBO0664287.1 ABC transporter substrate-binding protein [Jiella flava]MCD2472790.1 ABC transporter substrate-binding protein [Jiella flava]